MAAARRAPSPIRSAPRARTRGTSDDFFRHMVANMRNGVLAINRSGALVLINDEACRIFGLPARSGLSRASPTPTSSAATPTSSACSAARSSWPALPNRAELRLKSTAKVIGYTLSLVRDERDETIGAALFFKDLTHVEQMEERERLRDRLAALGEMAATMAHEIKNPLGGHRGDGRAAAAPGARQPRRAGAGHATSSTKPRWPTPSSRRCSTSSGRCGCSSIARRSARRCQSAVTMADGKAARGDDRRVGARCRRSCRRCRPIGISSRRCSPIC